MYICFHDTLSINDQNQLGRESNDCLWATHCISDPVVHCFSNQGKLCLLWSLFSQVKWAQLHMFQLLAQQNWDILAFPEQMLWGSLLGPQLASMHAGSSWLPPTWQNRVNHKVLIWWKPDSLFFPFWDFSQANYLVGEYKKLLELGELSLSMPYIFKIEWKKRKKIPSKLFFLSFLNAVILPTQNTKKLKLIKEH